MIPVISTGDASLVYGWHEEMDTKTYSVSTATGEPIVNRFQSGDLDFYGGERMKCVSRSDWKGTFPTVKLELELTEAMQKEMTGIKQYEKIVVEGEQMPTLGSTATSHKLADMVELAYDDPKWEELLDQLTYEELCNLIGVGYHGTIPMVADCADYETYRSGKFIPGIMGTLFSLVDKLVSSLSATVVSIAVGFIGYHGLPTKATHYMSGMNWVVIALFCIVPMVAWVLTLWAMKSYELDGKKVKLIQKVNTARKEAIARGMTLEEAMKTITDETV